MELNKYQNVGSLLGNIADILGEIGASPVEQNFHKVLTQMLEILELQANALDDASAKIGKLEDQLERLRG